MEALLQGLDWGFCFEYTQLPDDWLFWPLTQAPGHRQHWGRRESDSILSLCDGVGVFVVPLTISVADLF